MRMLLIAAAFALAACAPQTSTDVTAPDGPDVVALPQTDAAGNRTEALTENPVANPPRWCTEDGAWCVVAADDIGPLAVHEPSGTAIELPPAQDAISLAPWPQIVRSPSADGETVLVGVMTVADQMYSGGGGTASVVTLYRVKASETTAQVVTTEPLPVSATISIRACFDEEDQRNRAEACHDEYEFVSEIRLDPASTSAPVLVLTTEATSYPGARARSSSDSTTEPPLTDADLVYVIDEACTYTRTFTADATGVYQPNEALPNCSDYLEP